MYVTVGDTKSSVNSAVFLRNWLLYENLSLVLRRYDFGVYL